MRAPASEDIQAKIDRAKGHLKGLNDEFSALVNREAESIFAPIDFDPQTGHCVSRVGNFRVDLTSQSVIAGEIHYQLRSALEHLVWALVKANHKKPDTGMARNATANGFPIRPVKPHDFVGETARKQLKGVRRAAIRIIEESQPYHAANPASHPLTTVKAFSDFDKHRALLLSTVNASNLGQFRMLYGTKNSVAIKGYRRVLKRGQRLVPGTKIAEFTVVPPIPEVYVNGRLSLSVRISDTAGDAEGSIEDSIAAVQAVFDRLKPYLGA